MRQDGQYLSALFHAAPPPSMSRALLDAVPQSNPVESLTPRELAVTTLYAQGMPIKVIATELHLSVKTVDSHLNNMRHKLGNPNRSQITAFALKHHLVGTEQLAVAAV